MGLASNGLKNGVKEANLVNLFIHSVDLVGHSSSLYKKGEFLSFRNFPDKGEGFIIFP